MAQDPFIRDNSPANDFVAIAPADADLATPIRALYVGGAGNVALMSPQGNVVTFTGVLAGSLLQVRAKQVRATNTTATGLVGLF